MLSVSNEQVLVLIAYVLSILGLLFGPSHLFGKRLSGESAPPWFLSKVVYAPLFGVVLLAVVHVLVAPFGLEVEPLLTAGMMGDVVLDKYDIVFLILSFAYLSISLDSSGFFEFCAFKIVRIARGDGLKLMVFLFLLCSGLTFFTSNDIVIISMTPIIIYVGTQAGIKNLVPLLIAQFIAANTASMGLYIGSPTNIVLGDATEMTFIDYFSWMIAPTVVATLVTLGMLLVIFHFTGLGGAKMQRSYELPDDGFDIRSSRPMWVKVGIFALCLVFLTISSFIHVELWVICFVTAVTMLGYDLFLLRRQGEPWRGFVLGVNRRMPWPIAPFVLCFFAMVRVITKTGITEAVAEALIRLGGGSAIKLSMIFGFVSAAVVNLLNDIPSTVFWADAVPHFEASMGSAEYWTTVYSIIVGVNPGCYLTLIGALAGLMWINIIRTQPGADQHRTPTGWDLTRCGLLVIVPVVFLSCLTVYLEVGLFKS